MSSMKARVPMKDLREHLRGYQARPFAEYSNGKRHVYFSNPMRKWITVRAKGAQAELEFTDDCPCSYDY